MAAVAKQGFRPPPPPPPKSPSFPRIIRALTEIVARRRTAQLPWHHGEQQEALSLSFFILPKLIFRPRATAPTSINIRRRRVWHFLQSTTEAHLLAFDVQPVYPSRSTLSRNTAPESGGLIPLSVNAPPILFQGNNPSRLAGGEGAKLVRDEEAHPTRRMGSARQEQLILRRLEIAARVKTGELFRDCNPLVISLTRSI